MKAEHEVKTLLTLEKFEKFEPVNNDQCIIYCFIIHSRYSLRNEALLTG